ncbi:hypothetical protein ACFOEM_06740 [Paenalcaligenes hominis]
MSRRSTDCHPLVTWYADAEAKPLNLSICIKEAEFLLSQAHKP